MPSIINSDDGVVSGTSGLKTTGGNDGLLNIQSNGSTVVAVTGSGISVTGTVSQTGVSTFAAGTVSAPSITFTGDTNTGIYSPGADQVSITTGGTQRVAVDASGNVGVGTGSPNGRLDITSTSAGANTNTLVLTNASSNASTATSLIFGVSTGPTTRNATIRGINTGGNAIDLAFLTSNGDVPVERMRVLNTGNILCLAGGSTTATGTGIAFPATQSASSDANTLDDYEEGTFDATLTPGGSGTITLYSIYNRMSYTKIGRQVTVSGLILVQSVSSPTGAGVSLGNLPFTSGNPGEGAGRAYAAIQFRDVSAATRTTAATQMNELSTSLDIFISAASFAGDDELGVTLTYFV